MEGLVVLLGEECQRQWGQPDGERHTAEAHINPSSCSILKGNNLQEFETAKLLFKYNIQACHVVLEAESATVPGPKAEQNQLSPPL